MLVRVVDGVMKKGQRIRMMGTNAAYDVERVGFFTPKMQQIDELGPGEIGFITAAIKEVADTRVGDTITDDRKPVTDMLPGFKPAIPVVFCGLFPVDADDFETLRAAMGKLRLNDASFSFEMETSAALGFGFRCGFLGLLHLEIIQERLHREFNLNLIATAPIGDLQDASDRRQEIEIHNPVDMPDVVKIAEIHEPWIEATILTPDEYLGSVLKLCQDRRGIAEGADLCRQPRHGEIRTAAQRSGVRFLRSAEVGLQGLCLVRLSSDRLQAGRSGQDADPRQQRAGRCALDAGAPPRAPKAAAAPWSRR